MIDIAEAQVMWMFGALERLATLGFLEPTPYQVSQNGIDTFIQLDDYRHNLFSNDNEMKELLSVILKSENLLCDEDLLDGIYVLVKDYKDNREHIVKYALSQQFA